MLNQWEPWACFPATTRPHLGVDGRQQHPCSLCGVYSKISFWLLSLQKILLCNDRMLEIEAFCCDLSIFHLDFNPEHVEIWGCRRHLGSQAVDLLFCDIDSPGLLANGSRIRSFPWRGSSVVGKSCSSSIESWGSVSSKIQNEHWDFWMQPLYLPTRGQLLFSPEVTDWVRWAGWICHTFKQVLRPILCYWNELPVVTVTQKLWPVIYL